MSSKRDVMDCRVVVFTDTYLPTVNGVTYTVRTWRDRWQARGGRMDVVYPTAEDYEPDAGEYPVRSVPFPFYDGFRLGAPSIPSAADRADIVHAHTPFGLGLGGLRLARRIDAPFVASYHTPAGEYTEYLAPSAKVADGLQRVTEAYERWFFGQADAVLAPSEETREHLEAGVKIDAPVAVVPNGVDIEQFHPVDPTGFRERYGLDTGRPIVGYTGRHGFEKHLFELVEAAEGMDVTVVFGGDGPARSELERRATAVGTGADVRFLGFLDREELPAFYSALDVFAFPSPVETQGLVALEANACGTPVVGVNSGALATTVVDGITGYHYESGDIAGFRTAIRRALDDRESLREACLCRRDEISVDHAVDALADVYRRVS